MAEEVINYSGNKNRTWLQNKIRGLTNRYHKYKRSWLWTLHTKLHPIELDYSKMDEQSIPILINNFNRLDLLKKQINWLLQLEDKVSIIIVDNKSTYPPLLQYYKELNDPQVQVVYLNFNSWRKGAEYIASKKIPTFEKYIITDSDLLPYPNTPSNLIAHLAYLLDKYPAYNHVGTSLEINDLPDHNPLKSTIFKYESAFWSPQTKLLNKEVYIAKIDTTFAMYRKSSTVLITDPALRTARPYTLKHIDWYRDPMKHTDEFQYYLNSCKSFATWAHESKKSKIEPKNYQIV